MSRSPSPRKRILIVLTLALGVAAAALPFRLRTSVIGGREAMARQRLGRAALAVVAPQFVEQTLVDRLQAATDIGGAFRDAAPLIAVDGVAATVDGAIRVPRVAVYGVDDRFWRLHGVDGVNGPSGADLLAGPALGTALGIEPGAAMTLTIAHADDVPRGTVHGRRDDPGRVLRLRLTAFPAGSPGAALSPLAQSGDVPAAFVPLSLLQDEPAWRGRINAILVSTGPDVNRRINPATVESAIARQATLADYGLGLRIDDAARSVVLETRTGLLDDALVDAATRATLDIGGLPTPVMTMLVESMRRGDRRVPYSFVTSIELQAVAPDMHAEELDRPPIVLNDWAARELGASVGDVISLDFPVWHGSGRLTSDSAAFQVAGVLPLAGVVRQPLLTPVLPGITGRSTMADWTPRVPFDAGRVRPVDEAYWSQFGATPKGFVPPQIARALWRSGQGSATSVQIAPPDGMSLEAARHAVEARLRERIVPSIAGVTARDVSADARSLAEAEARSVAGLTWAVAPLVVACLLAAVIWGAAAPLTRGDAIVLAAIATACGLVVSPGLAAGYQWLSAPAGRDVGLLAGLAGSRLTAAAPLVAGLLVGVGAALLVARLPPLLSRRAARGAVAAAAGLAMLAASGVAWMTRRPATTDDSPKHRTSGGYALFMRTTLPLAHDPAAPEGQAELGLSAMPDVRVAAFRVHDDGSATLRRPVGPAGLRLAAVSEAFIDEGRFTFTATLDRTDEERANPWLLLRREQRDRSDPAAEAVSPVVPVITSARTLAGLQRHLGDDLSITVAGRPLRLRFVATIEDALFGDALLMTDRAFAAWFPAAAGYHWLAIEVPPQGVDDVRAAVAAAAIRLGGSIEDAAQAARSFDDRTSSHAAVAYALLVGAGLLALSTLPSAAALRP